MTPAAVFPCIAFSSFQLFPIPSSLSFSQSALYRVIAIPSEAGPRTVRPHIVLFVSSYPPIIRYLLLSLPLPFFWKPLPDVEISQISVPVPVSCLVPWELIGTIGTHCAARGKRPT